MIKEIIPNNDFIKAHSNKFDLEIIFYLNFQEKSIVKLGSICSCLNLIQLNLSRNKLTDLKGIELLVELKNLDLSFNKIKSIENLSSCKKLKCLYLQGNLIDKNINSVTSSLSNLKSLTKLYFQEISGNNSNPICSVDGYRETIFKTCVKLNNLDGTTKEIDLISMYKILSEDSNEKKTDLTHKLGDFNLKSKNFY